MIASVLMRLSSRLGCVGEAIEDFVPGDCTIDDDMTDKDSLFGAFLRDGEAAVRLNF
jgi:hypothetical protein